MARKQLIIEFKPKGDKALVKAIRNLDIVTNRLQKTTSIYEKELKAMGLTQRQVTLFLNKQNKASILGIKNNRLLGNSFATLRSKLLLVSFGIGLVTAGLRRLIDNTIEQELAEKKLESALGRVNTELLNQASALQQVTSFGDENIISAQALIAAYTDDEEAIKKATVATLDLAAAKGMDLKTAADLVGKSLGSSTNALSRYGVRVKGTVGSTKRLESLTENVSRLFGGQAQAQTKTLSGAINQLKNALGDTNEELGDVFVPFIQSASEAMKTGAENAGDWLRELQGEDDLGRLIREVEKAGGDATELRLRQQKELLAQNQKQLGVSANLEMLEESKKIKEGERLDLLHKQDIQMQSIASSNEDYNDIVEKSEQSTKTLGYWIGDWADRLRGVDRQALIIEKTNAKITLTGVNAAKENIKNAEDEIAQIDKKIKLKKEEQLIIEEIARLEAKAAGEDPDKPGFFERIFGKFTDEQQLEILMNNVKKVTNAVAGVGNAYDQVKMQQINQAKQAELDTANSIRNERIRTKKIEEIEAKYAEKTRKHKEKMKEVKVAEAISNTALGISAAYDEPFPLNLMLAALIAAQGAMQIKTIKSQKYQYGGLVGGRRHSQGGTMIEAEQGEFVMSREATEAVGIENLNRMNTGLGGGGGASIVINNPILGKDTIEDEIVPQIKEALRRGGSIA